MNGACTRSRPASAPTRPGPRPRAATAPVCPPGAAAWASRAVPRAPESRLRAVVTTVCSPGAGLVGSCSRSSRAPLRCAPSGGISRRGRLRAAHAFRGAGNCARSRRPRSRATNPSCRVLTRTPPTGRPGGGAVKRRTQSASTGSALTSVRCTTAPAATSKMRVRRLRGHTDPPAPAAHRAAPARARPSRTRRFCRSTIDVRIRSRSGASRVDSATTAINAVFVSGRSRIAAN